MVVVKDKTFRKIERSEDLQSSCTRRPMMRTPQTGAVCFLFLTPPTTHRAHETEHSCNMPELPGAGHVLDHGRPHRLHSVSNGHTKCSNATQPPTVICKLEAQLESIHVAYTSLHVWAIEINH